MQQHLHSLHFPLQIVCSCLKLAVWYLATLSRSQF